MPRAALRPCSAIGCPRLVRGKPSRCPEHRRAVWREYETRRPQRALTTTFYNSAAWKKARAEALRRTGGLCSVFACGRAAAHVDHITPVKAGGDPLAQENLQPLCLSHHSSKTARENHASGRW